MQIFGHSNKSQDIEERFLQAVADGDVDRVENLLKRQSHEVGIGCRVDRERGTLTFEDCPDLNLLKRQSHEVGTGCRADRERGTLTFLGLP